MCDEVTIRTTKGGLRFDSEGRHNLRSQQPSGSRIECLIRMTAEECRSLEPHVRKLIPPKQIITTFNGAQLQSRPFVEQFNAILRTELADPNGYVRLVEPSTFFD